MSAMTVSMFVVVGLLLLAINEIPTMPKCPFCGKTREHAKNCSTNHRGGDDGR